MPGTPRTVRDSRGTARDSRDSQGQVSQYQGQASQNQDQASPVPRLVSTQARPGPSYPGQSRYPPPARYYPTHHLVPPDPVTHPSVPPRAQLVLVLHCRHNWRSETRHQAHVVKMEILTEYSPTDTVLERQEWPAPDTLATFQNS